MTWLSLAAPATVFFAAIGRSALREDQALRLVPNGWADREPPRSADERYARNRAWTA